MLRLSFIGNSIIEISTDEGQKERPVMTLHKLAIYEVKDFDVITGRAKKRDPNSSAADNTKENIERAIFRLRKCADTCRGEAARNWYSATLMTAKKEMEDLP